MNLASRPSMIAHNNDIAQLAGRIVRMEDGRIAG